MLKNESERFGIENERYFFQNNFNKNRYDIKCVDENSIGCETCNEKNISMFIIER